MSSKPEELDKAYRPEVALLSKGFIKGWPWFNQNEEELKILFAWAILVMLGKPKELDEAYEPKFVPISRRFI